MNPAQLTCTEPPENHQLFRDAIYHGTVFRRSATDASLAMTDLAYTLLRKMFGSACSRGDKLLFSGAHFHVTRLHSEQRARFSRDFRIVDIGDLAQNKGAPSVDDRSTGNAVPDYIQPGRVQWSFVPL